MAPLFRFPPEQADPADVTFLAGKGGHFAKLKIESKAGKKTVFLTEHTLIFVFKGIKLLHLPDHTLEVSPDTVVLLRKGVYVMAEYMEAGLDFEAVLLFLPGGVLRSLAADLELPQAAHPYHYKIFRANELTQAFKSQIRQYFNRPLVAVDSLFAIKQKEIVLLLLSAGYHAEMAGFIRNATLSGPEELDFVMRHYLLQPLSLADLALLTNRSLASFKRDFQAHYRCAPRQWINRERLNQARLLLHNTDQRIAEIAASCGFESTSHFIRLFKKQFQCTPGEWRAGMVID